MSGEKDFLDEFAEADLPEAIEPASEPQMEPAGRGPVRGPDGKFVKAEAQAKAEQAEKGAKDAAGEAAITEPPSDDEDGQTVPLSVLKALRKELQELKRSQGVGTQTQTNQPKAPDIPRPSVAFDENPVLYTQQALVSQKTQMSQFIASQQYGEDLMQQAWTAFVTSPDPRVIQYSYELLEHPHPVGEMVKWYQEQQELNAIRQAGGIEALKQQWLAEMGQQAPAQAQAQGRPPPSLAGTGKARSSSTTGEPADGFDALFKR
jgi:hypothetical protein